MMTSVDPCIFLGDLDEEDTLVDVQRWNPASTLPEVAEDDFDTPVMDPPTVRVPRRSFPLACKAQRMDAHRRVFGAFPMRRDPLKPPK